MRASRKWRVWSRDPQSRRWMVVVDGTTEDDARTRADGMMATARKFVLVGAAYVARPPGEKPTAEHDDLAIKPPVEPDLRLTGTGTITAEESPVTLTGTARLSVASDPARNLDAPSEAEDRAATARALLGVTTAAEGAENMRKIGHLLATPPDPDERFTPEAFAPTVGKVVSMRLARDQGQWVRITAADVAEDGYSVTLRLEPDDGEPDTPRR